MHFTIQHKDPESSARAGVLNTGHGEIQTPVFMPVGTAGTVKSVHQRELVNDIKAPIILGNTYHLYLRPGMETLTQAGGLHRFMNWNQAILTDSGGYQVFSLSANRKLNEEGVIFRSHIDGSSHVFTPEGIVDIQRIIGADIIMALDECTSYPCEIKEAKISMELTHRWLDRGCMQFMNTDPKYGFNQLFFPIVQGSVYPELRKISAAKIAGTACAGNAIGGLSVGEPEEQMYEMIQVVNDILPADKPRYLMGVGTPANILECISLGIDMFDCVMPTRNARNGMLFTSEGIINIRNLKWKNDFTPVDEKGNTFVDLQYSKAYLRHLVISGEILGAQIATIHNLGFYLWLVREAGNKIREGNFLNWKNIMVMQLKVKAMKKPQLLIIDRYIISKFLGTFLYAIIIIIVISCIFDLSEHIDDYFEHKSTFKDVALHYYLNFIPYFTILFSPLIVFISVIYFTSRMAYSMEIIALLSNGMSFNRLMRPYMLAAFVIALVTFTINSFILPYANTIRNEFMDRTFRTTAKNYYERNIHKQIMPGVYIYMENYSVTSNIGFKFSIEKFDEGKLVSKLISDFIRWDSTKSIWTIRNYYIRSYNGLKETVSEGVVMDTALNMRPGDFAIRDDSYYETMTMRKLNNYISALKMQGSETITFYQVEKHKRLAFPFSTFILTLIGVTLSSRKIKGGIGMHIGAGLGLSFSYIFFMQFSSQFAINGSLPPFLAAWTPNIIFGIIIVVLYKIAPK